MLRCIELAKNALGQTYPNPLVGAVIVYNGKIIGEGYHRKAGMPHAEINAINSVKNPELLPKSDIYVSLEPCSHFGKTPPCAVRLKEIGFRRVIIGSGDPNALVNGNGIRILKDAGIPVTTGILAAKCNELNKRFFTFHQKKRPFIILKWAETADGFLDNNFRPAKISNLLATQFVHKMRTEEQAILVGTNTAITDNPSLTARNYPGKNPAKILIDFDLKVPETFKIFDNSADVLVFNSVKDEENEHIKYIKISRENFISDLMHKPYENSIESVIVEGGSRILQTFIDANLWDEAVIIKNTVLNFGNGTKAPVFNYEPASQEIFRDNVVNFYRNV